MTMAFSDFGCPVYNEEVEATSQLNEQTTRIISYVTKWLLQQKPLKMYCRLNFKAVMYALMVANSIARNDHQKADRLNQQNGRMQADLIISARQSLKAERPTATSPLAYSPAGNLVPLTAASRQRPSKLLMKMGSTLVLNRSFARRRGAGDRIAGEVAGHERCGTGGKGR
ncbi:hypothetical protein PR202_ga25091 [Eleusine coracana subsp. coracana]|uniref:Uncharacterized protein n=1 Tax=Eleusine coracana subsp. coracana TaxID=191504 RepID=A0AAV5DB07_ELECO|nr:hypothetical protein PR202_ga25091 [Eleusine coracana subsp. coracana]